MIIGFLIINYVPNYFRRLVTVWITKVALIISKMRVIELFLKMINLCNRLLLEMFRKLLGLWIFKAFILACCIEGLRYWGCANIYIYIYIYIQYIYIYIYIYIYQITCIFRRRVLKIFVYLNVYMLTGVYLCMYIITYAEH